MAHEEEGAGAVPKPCGVIAEHLLTTVGVRLEVEESSSVSSMTARRDLADLERHGVPPRAGTPGGRSCRPSPPTKDSFAPSGVETPPSQAARPADAVSQAGPAQRPLPRLLGR